MGYFIEKRIFRRVGLAALAMGGIFIFVSLLVGLLSGILAQFTVLSGDFVFVIGFLGSLGTYGLSIGILMLILRGLPKAPEGPRLKLTFKGFLGYFCVSNGAAQVLAYAGISVAFLVATLLKGPQNFWEYFQRSNQIPLGSSALQTALQGVLICVVAPLAEELMFRKLLLDPIRPLGEKVAVFYNGILFGLLHMAFSPIFYASALGMILAYIMIRTNNLRYCIALHFAVNASSFAMMLLAGMFPETGSPDDLPLLEALFPPNVYGGYQLLIILISLLGLVLFFVHIRKVRFFPPQSGFSQKTGAKLAFLNIGTIPYALLCIAVAVFAAIV